MNMLAIILLQVGCMQDLSIIELFHRMQLTIKIIQRSKLTMPVLAIGGGYIPVLGGNITMPSVVYGMKILAQNVQGIKVPNTGHFIPEEQPQFVIKQLANFFGKNNTN